MPRPQDSLGTSSAPSCMMMAKPKHGRLNNVLPSNSRNRPIPPHAPRFPSPAVLSALAVIATVPPVVAGTPLPPTHPPAFLCPFIERDSIPVAVPRSVDIPSGSGQPPIPAPRVPPTNCEVVADKYVQGPDSLWRKTDKWTLYGSTCWSNLTGSTSTSTSDVQSQPSSSQTSMPASTPSPNDLDTSFDTSVLPAGWDGATTFKSGTESTIILALAIVLASSICLFMIGCVIWRRRKKKARDMEHKLGQKRGAHDDSQDTRCKMRVWAKATARWKSNVRHSARRRRKRQCVSSTNRPPSPTFSDSPQLSLVAPPAPSRRSSIASEEPDPSRPEAILSRDGNVTEPSVVLHDSRRPASPPTYGASFVPRRPPPSFAVPNSSSTPLPVGPDSVQRSNHPSFIDDEPLPYVPPSDGHVATDDKSQLAYIRQLASSPPMSIDAASANAMQSVSAPEWHEVEDDLEGLDIHLGEVPTSFHDLGLPPSFPPPPSKADIPSPFRYLDDHPLRYEGDDTLASVHVPGSSLGAFPSAPPVDDPGLEPSAPSLEDEDELFQDWDGASSYVPEVHTSADPDSTPTRAMESPILSPVSAASCDASLPSILESAARDGILPRYHP